MLTPMGALITAAARRTSSYRILASLLLASLVAVPAAGCFSGCSEATKATPETAGEPAETNRQEEPAEPSLASRFDEDRAWSLLEQIVAIGPRPSGGEKSGRQRDLIANELSSAGLTPVREAFQDKTPIGGVSFENLYADIPGAGDAPPIVVIASHFDTKRGIADFVGANDGGSSTAVLLELARVLAGRTDAVTWRLLFLDGEEAVLPDWVDPDNRYGSRHHVKRLKETGELARVKAFVLLDMVGDKDLRFETDTNSTRELLQLFFDVARANGLGQYVGAPPRPILDDHLSFLAEGVPSVDLIDLSFGPYNSYWHTTNDTLANCSKASLGVTGRLVLHALPALESFARAR